MPPTLDALLLIGNGSEKFAMQVQVKNLRHRPSALDSERARAIQSRSTRGGSLILADILIYH